MSSTIDLKFVFQGGGAKLALLLAAAHAVHDLSSELNFRVESVSGSSAGAIAATVLAMGLNPDAFREKLIRLAENHFEDIIKPITWWSPFRALRGYTLYGAASYRAFLNELFTDGEGIPHLKNKKIPNVMIHATNIGIGAPKVYDGTLEEDTIAEALFSSSALPFIFRNFPEQNSFIDGGLIDNFPVERIIGNSDGRDVFGFSFKKTSEYAFNGPLSYLAAMLFTSMDYSVERSLARIPKDNVYFIKTDIGILDFDKALELLKNKTNYNKEKQVIADALKDFVIKKREKIQLAEEEAKIEKKSAEALSQKRQEKIEELRNAVDGEVRHVRSLIDKFKNLHKSIGEPNLSVKKRVYYHRCNCLKQRDSKADDEVTCEDHVVVHADTYTYGARITGSPSFTGFGDIDFRVIDKRNNQVSKGICVEVPSRYLSTDPEEYNILVFFPQPLLATNADGYILTYSFTYNQILYDLILDKKMDAAAYYTTTAEIIDELNLTFFIPVDFSRPILNNLDDVAPGLCSPEINKVLREDWPLDVERVRGVEMSAAELAALHTPAGFQAIGWKASNFGKRKGTAFVASLSSKT